MLAKDHMSISKIWINTQKNKTPNLDATILSPSHIRLFDELVCSRRVFLSHLNRGLKNNTTANKSIGLAVLESTSRLGEQRRIDKPKTHQIAALVVS